VRRRRTNDARPRERRTLIPTFDPEALAREIEDGGARATKAPPFDPSSYARIVEQRVSVAGEPRDTPGTMVAAAASSDDQEDELGRAATVAPPARRAPRPSDAALDLDDTETVGREMYSCYLSSAFPEALVLAERVLERDPAHAFAQLVAARCRERLESHGRSLSPTSVLRLRFAELERQARNIDPTSSFVLGHIDGISDAATVAALTGLPGGEALDRLHALVDLGVLEVVSF